ncbi:MAG: methylated-DNA--[protein]-cysteine S-methyltransferase [Bacillota bacterium]|nr:methylated-DNA--[protein]-cysteine S-methyltransferase [Bacillota bacterium]
MGDLLWRGVTVDAGRPGDKGIVGVAYTEAGLYALELPDKIESRLESVSEKDPAWLAGLAADLRDYFAGRPVCFTAPLDDRDYPPFFRRALAACARIPWGESRTYRWLAMEADSPQAVRAAGQAMASNRIPIVVPCHRVLRSDGGLGGFNGGLHWKRKLLRLEKVLGEDTCDAD